MNRKNSPEPIGPEDGPFTYTYISISAVPGLKFPSHIKGDFKFFSYPELNGEAFLTQDWDSYCLHMDRGNAFGSLMLTAFRGSKRFGKLSIIWQRLMAGLLGDYWMFKKRLERETEVAREGRHKRYKSTGCYLVYKAEGDLLEPIRFDTTGKFGDLGFGLDVLRGESYRAIHRSALHSAATSLSLALVDTNGSPDTNFIGDAIYLNGKNGLSVYPRTVNMGNPKVIISSLLDDTCLEVARGFVPGIVSDHRIETAISLYIQSQDKRNDNLRSFIAAWSALELFVNRVAKVTRNDWFSLLEGNSQVVPEWDKNLKNVAFEDYRLRDRFLAMVCVLDPKAAKSDSVCFIRANNMRSGYYHRMEVKDKDLPTNDVRVLFRKYLKLGLVYQSRKVSSEN